MVNNKLRRPDFSRSTSPFRRLSEDLYDGVTLEPSSKLIEDRGRIRRGIESRSTSVAFHGATNPTVAIREKTIDKNRFRNPSTGELPAVTFDVYDETRNKWLYNILQQEYVSTLSYIRITARLKNNNWRRLLGKRSINQNFLLRRWQELFAKSESFKLFMKLNNDI